jgi:hypothetical protein
MLIPKVLGFVMAEVRRDPLMIALGTLLQHRDWCRDPVSQFYFSGKAVRGMRDTKNSRTINMVRAKDPRRPCHTVSSHLAKVSLNSTDPVLKVGRRYRMLTPREVARIQAFPDRFKLECSRSTAYRGHGNAVPPCGYVASWAKPCQSANSRRRELTSMILRRAIVTTEMCVG